MPKKPVITRTPKEVFEHWIAALRSCQYKQTDGQLRAGMSNKFCCVGVLCELARKDGAPAKWSVWGGFVYKEALNNTPHIFTEKSEEGEMPEIYRKYLKLTVKEVENLYKMNDDQEKSFEEIANHIEQKLMPKALTRTSVK